MGRRATHTSEELRSLVIDAASMIIAERGFEGLSAREIARRIDYSPGTLYNVFENLNDLVLAVEGRVLDQLIAALEDIPDTACPRERVRLVARRYVQFAQDNQKLWELLSAHRLPVNHGVPRWYSEKLEQIVSRLKWAASSLAASDGQEDPEQERLARALWVAIHGMTGLAMEAKAAAIAGDGFDTMFDDFVGTYVDGLAARSLI